MNSSKMKFVVGGFVVVAALAWMGSVGFEESKAYYITVDEYSAMQENLHGKTLKIAGDVVTGSINRRVTPIEFVISHEGESLKVRYVGKGVLPDTFKDGSKAVVEGKIAPDGVFQANHIEAKCASKYEAEYEKRGT